MILLPTNELAWKTKVICAHILGDRLTATRGTGIALETKRERTSSPGGNKAACGAPKFGRRFFEILSPRRQGEAGSVLYQQKFLSAHQAATRSPTLRVACVLRAIQSLTLIHHTKEGCQKPTTARIFVRSTLSEVWLCDDARSTVAQ
jgi:hypothetical protein